METSYSNKFIGNSTKKILVSLFHIGPIIYCFQAFMIRDCCEITVLLIRTTSNNAPLFFMPILNLIFIQLCLISIKLVYWQHPTTHAPIFQNVITYNIHYIECRIISFIGIYYWEQIGVILIYFITFGHIRATLTSLKMEFSKIILKSKTFVTIGICIPLSELLWVSY